MVIEVKEYHFNVQCRPNEGKPLICFLHGFMGSAEDWRAISEIFSRDYSTLSIDLPGHGETKVEPFTPGSFRMEPIALAIIELIQKLGYSETNLVGYSMGGRLALYMALKYPEVIKRCALESASPGLKTEAEQLTRQKHDESLAQELLSTNFSNFLEKWYNQPLFKSLKALPTFSELFEKRLKNSPEALAVVLQKMGTGVQPALWKELKNAINPILALVGEKDSKFVNIGKEMSEHSALIHAQCVANTGHLIHVENQPEFINRLYQFFDKTV